MPARIIAEAPQPPTASTSCRSSTTRDVVRKRLDALDARLAWCYVRVLLLTGASWALRSAEFVLFAFTRHLVARDVAMGTNAWEILGIGEYLGAAFGGQLFGVLADFRGRRSALMLAMVLSLAGLALSAVVTQDYQLICAKIVAGVGFGGELPAAIVLVQELSPKSMRGPMVAWLEAFAGVGGIVGVALAFGLAPAIGWRNTYLAVCACGLYTGVLRCGIPESPRWLASAGRGNAAFKALEKLEQEHGVRPRYDSIKVQKAPTPADAKTVPLGAKVKPSVFDKAVPTLILWALWTVMAVSSYALGVYLPTLISLIGFNMYASWTTIVLLHGSQVAGCILASWMLETRGRMKSLACFAMLASVASIVLSYAPWYYLTVTVGTCLVSISLAGAWCCVLVWTPENYPTAVRARGMSYAFGFSRLGAAGAAMVYPHMFEVWLMSVSSITWVFAGILAVMVLGVVVPYGSDRRSRPGYPRNGNPNAKTAATASTT